MKNILLLLVFILNGVFLTNLTAQGNTGISKSKKVSITRAPKFPPNLNAIVSFNEPSGNQLLDAQEKAYMVVKIKNKGKGKGKGVKLNIFPESVSGLKFQSYYEIGDISPGEEKKINIPIKGKQNLKTKAVSFNLIFNEKNDFEPDEMRLSFNTKSFEAPEFILVDGFNIDDANSNGMIEKGEQVTITAAIQNIGQGIAKNVQVILSKDKMVFFLPDAYEHQSDGTLLFSLGKMNPGEMKEFTFDTFTNKKAEEIQIVASITESYGQYGKSDIRLPLELKKSISRIKEVQVVGVDNEKVDIQHASGFNIDIETNIPETNMENKDGIAVIIGNRNYQGDIPMVDFAIRDAEFMKEYLIKTLGYKPGNILHYQDATLSKMKVAFNKLKNYVKKGKSDVFVYYSGHGAPDPESNQGYFVPVDADPNYIKESGYPVNDLYGLLNDIDTKSTTVLIDACFSGSSDEGMILKDISPVFIEVNESSLITDNSTVMTSAAGDQVSSWYRDKKHSLFTYYFLKAIQGEGDLNKDKKLTFAEIESYIDENVPYQARRINGRDQTPQLDSTDKERVFIQY